MLGSPIFWLASRKSMTGPGFTIIVVDTSAQHINTCRHYQLHREKWSLYCID
jgi:hypothetical protein